MQDMQPQNPDLGAEPLDTMPQGQVDHEGAMAKADLYKLANYSLKLFKQIEDGDQLESWVQAKITKAADYVASVYHYLEYEMKFSEYGAKLENSEMYSEGQKLEIKNKLMEAKEKIKALKVKQAEKLDTKGPSKEAKDPQPKDNFDEKVNEGVLSGGERPCTECGGTGMVYEEPKAIPDHVKSKVEKYNRQAKAMHAASKRLDKNNNGIPDDEEVEEGFDEKAKTGDSFKTRTGVATKTSTGVRHTNTSHSDEEHGEPASKVKEKSAAEKKADKEKEIKLPKHTGNTWGMKGGEKVGNGAKPAKKEEEVDETYGQGIYSEAKSKKAKKDYDKDGKIESEKDEVIGSRRKAAGLDEAAPSAGMTKKEKSSTVKAAKAGKDIGKPGKNFSKVAAKAAKEYGSKEKGEKVAAAAMWKNKAKAMNESVEAGDQSLDQLIALAVQKDPAGLQKVANDPQALFAFLQGFMQNNQAAPATTEPAPAAAPETAPLAESTDLARMKEFLTRLNG